MCVRPNWQMHVQANKEKENAEWSTQALAGVRTFYTFFFLQTDYARNATKKIGERKKTEAEVTEIATN